MTDGTRPVEPAQPEAALPRDAVPVEGIRRVIAERMTLSAQTAPRFSLSIAGDISETESLRNHQNARLERQSRPKVALTAVLVKVCAWALTQHPWANTSLVDGRARSHDEVHVGVAVAPDKGLVVPVLRHADRRGLEETAADLEDLVARACGGSLKTEQFSGGTSTVSNLGMFGIDRFRAIINPPESAILAVGRAVRTAIPMQDDRIVVRPMLDLTLTCDHRVIDGATGAAFLRQVADALEHPGLMVD